MMNTDRSPARRSGHPCTVSGCDLAEPIHMDGYGHGLCGPNDALTANGVIQGKEGKRLDPQGNATRAEVATMLQRFCALTD